MHFNEEKNNRNFETCGSCFLKKKPSLNVNELMIRMIMITSPTLPSTSKEAHVWENKRNLNC